MEYRYAMAKVTVTANLPTSVLPVWTEWSTCSPSVVISESSGTSEKAHCQQSRYRLCAHSAVAPISSAVKSGIETLVASCPQPWKQTRNCSNSSCPGTGAATEVQLVEQLAENQVMERSLHTREIIIYVGLFAFVACILILLALFFCQWKGSRSFFPKPFNLSCCLPGTTPYHSEKRGIFPKDPLLLNDFKQSTMTIRNPITLDSRQKSCDGKSLGIPQTDISSQPITSLPTDHQYSLPIYDRAAISSQSSLGLPCQILENPSSFPLPIGLAGTISHPGVLPPVPSFFQDPLLCAEKCEGNEVFLQNTPYCVTSVEPLRSMLPFTQNQSLLTVGDLAGASTTYTQINECPGRNILPDMLDLNSGTTAAQQLFSAHKVGSVLTEASSGKSSSNMATNTTAVGSVNADSSNGSLGIGATHSPSGLLLAQTGEAVVGDGETRQYNSNYSNGVNPPWNYSCEIQESDVVISANLTENGGLICSSTSGVYLKIPQGAVHGISEESVYLAICRDERIRPILGDHQTLLSPIVQFGPVSMHPHQGVILSFPHCAALNEGPWYLRVVATGIQSTPTVPKCKEDNEYEQEGHDSVTRSSVLTWKEVCAIVSQNDEYKIIDSQHGMTCHIDTLEVHLLTQQPQRYCLIGETFFRPRLEQRTLELPPVWPVNIKNDRPAKKMLRLTAYSARPTPTMDYNIRVYILPDIRDILEHVKATELRLDGYVLDTTDPLPFYDTGQGMCFSIEDVSKGWRSRLHMNTQEVPFRHIWGGTQLPTLHCAFTLEHIDHTQNSVSCRIIAFQGMNWEQRKILHISSDCIDNATSPTNTVPVAIPSKQMAFFRMKDSTREMICDFMNIENNWRELAKKMKFESHIPYLAKFANPSEALLNLWEALHRQDQYLGDIKELFCQLGHTDFATSLAVEQETFWDIQ
ncbi:Netrin receptor UNC5B-b [Clonorchis sinensis]|uniref:Netrin receptor UNC5 n=1 Tax=Clonorchis sinensis TaxID=79923 RepID=A0A8T1M8B5_CLOSI|nr:Netrin receptor UNC5B-b [Clonorchis sinensis]